MAIDYSLFAIPKGPRHCKVIAKAKTARKSRDEAESDKVRERSGGRCEITVQGTRCGRRAGQVHHRKGGHGQRGRGESALAKHKDHACDQCHKKITDGDLVHVEGHAYRVRPASKGEK